MTLIEGKAPDILISDRDGLYGGWMKKFLLDLGVNLKQTTYRMPIFNAYAERMVRTFREELTDRMLIYNERDLEKILADYEHYYNNSRTHSSLSFNAPNRNFSCSTIQNRSIVRRKVLDGLIIDFEALA